VRVTADSKEVLPRAAMSSIISIAGDIICWELETVFHELIKMTDSDLALKSEL